ncbi:MAG: arginine--tRNA ligase [Egibacteraceae bacterium]
MGDPIEILTRRLEPAFAAVATPGVPAPVALRRSDRADYQADGALALAKPLRRSPRDIARDVVEAADLDDLCEMVEVSGPGFVNLTLRAETIAGLLGRMVPDERLDVAANTSAEIVVVDYSAPNVAKEMHVGHLRSTVIGDAIVRLYDWLGNHVIRQNHLGDWGTPFGMLVEHLTDVGEANAALSQGDLTAFYQQARHKFDTDEPFKERSRRRVVALQSGDPETLRLWRVLYDHSSRYFQYVYERLGVLLTPADDDGESRYNPMLPSVVEELDTLGLLETSEGAQCVFPPGFANRQGEPLPMIVRKADGGYGYAATDLACIRMRSREFGATRMAYVVGAPQREHFQMVFAVARMAGWITDKHDVRHVEFGSILGPDRKVLRTRSGESVKLIDLLDEGVERAAAQVRSKLPDLDEPGVAAVASAVGIGAIKYADLSSDRVKDYVFDWDRMLSFDGNTAPYLQYAHTRIRSIFRRAGETLDLVSVPRLGEPAERTLALALLGFEEAVRASAERYQPHRLCGYLYELATVFTTFYETCPVLRAGDAQTRASRLTLCDLTARVLGTGLGLLGIDAPDRM